MLRTSALFSLGLLILLSTASARADNILQPAAASSGNAPPSVLGHAPEASHALDLTTDKDIAIAPHRALYKLGLASVKNSSNVVAADGDMLFEWSDTCDGWAVQQRLHMHFTYNEGGEVDIVNASTSWESDDGRRYRFNARRQVNGADTGVWRGTATLDETGAGVAHYDVPSNKKDMVLPPGSMFPSAHTMVLIDKATHGEKLFTKRVFDGTDEDGAEDITAFIGPSSPVPTSGPEARLADMSLLKAPAWSVRLAFFKADVQTEEPDYEMNFSLQNNGIGRSMTIDYNDFSVAGSLIKLEPMPNPDCQSKH